MSNGRNVQLEFVLLLPTFGTSFTNPANDLWIECSCYYFLGHSILSRNMRQGKKWDSESTPRLNGSLPPFPFLLQHWLTGQDCFKFHLAYSVIGVFCHPHPAANIPRYNYFRWWVVDPLDRIHFKLFLLHHVLFFAWMRHGKIQVLAITSALVVIVWPFCRTIPMKNLATNARWSRNDMK